MCRSHGEANYQFDSVNFHTLCRGSARGSLARQTSLACGDGINNILVTHKPEFCFLRQIFVLRSDVESKHTSTPGGAIGTLSLVAQI